VFQKLVRDVAIETSRPSIEFYRSRKVIDLLLPVKRERSAASSRAKGFAQPPSRSGCTLTHTRSCHALNSSVPGRPGIRRCQ
jgi:hypothetical protein